ncbi:hypothetical protein JX266_004980 [Neoarthrinium moseri]|uniref:uncharacterized protein n=1 Tax=Neoarthrinium moseri TaxID=1658444 RepID=UPI001FDCF525|nr:uncharacterized protein JN550_008850 [Neoarthrinium moseri]KAI1849485.1 hypothetical protein JX266_004980 [Neoarthrinium moseri]KAI1864563.1 hypothetical protein JN550_008850 [Neoarthrinium moseri]
MTFNTGQSCSIAGVLADWKVLLGLLIIIITTSIRSYIRLSHVPGPLFQSISSLGFLKTHLDGSPHSEILRWTQKYGPLVRVGPNSVITSDVKTVQRISGVKSPYSKGGWYRPFRFIKERDHSFSTVHEPSHTAFRSKIAAGFRGSAEMEQAVDRQLRCLVALIDRKYVSRISSGDKTGFCQIMDIAAITHLFALDIVGDITFGKAFGFLDEGYDFYGFLKWNKDFFSVAATSAVLPTLARAAQLWPFRGALPKATDPAGLGKFIRHSEEVVGARYKEGPDGRRDLVGMFMKMGVTKDEAVNQLLVSVVAGTDSVATAIRRTVLFLTSNPRAYKILLSELDKAKADGLLSSPVQSSEARQLPYLQAVVREGLRIYPGGTPLAFKEVPIGGDMVAGYRLPAGTQVGMDVWGALRNTQFWGEDADLFRPERWLNLAEARFSSMVECLDFQFGYGRYQCLGRPLVFMEMNKTLPELLSRYEFAIVDPAHPADIKNAGFYLMNGFNVVVTVRA